MVSAASVLGSGSKQPPLSGGTVDDLELEISTTPDYTGALAATEAVRREVHSLYPDLDAALQLVTDRVLSLTRAKGAAIALSGGDNLICRASSGDAPSLGAVLEAGSGFSGHCVRSGQLLYCSDSEIDPYVDRVSCA